MFEFKASRTEDEFYLLVNNHEEDYKCCHCHFVFEWAEDKASWFNTEMLYVTSALDDDTYCFRVIWTTNNSMGIICDSCYDWVFLYV